MLTEINEPIGVSRFNKYTNKLIAQKAGTINELNAPLNSTKLVKLKLKMCSIKLNATIENATAFAVVKSVFTVTAKPITVKIEIINDGAKSRIKNVLSKLTLAFRATAIGVLEPCVKKLIQGSASDKTDKTSIPATERGDFPVISNPKIIVAKRVRLKVK